MPSRGASSALYWSHCPCFRRFFHFLQTSSAWFPPQTLLYLVIIFILILKQFGATIKLSRMDRQITELTQTLALKEARRQTDDPQSG